MVRKFINPFHWRNFNNKIKTMFKGHFISLVYLITALIFGALALVHQTEEFDLALKEVYFVLPESLLWLILGISFLIFAGISLAFELFRKRMNSYLFGMHYLLTILSLLIIYFAVQQQAPPTVHTDYSVMDELREQSDDPVNWIEWVSTASYALVIAQILFGINILLSIIQTRRKNTHKE